MQVRVFWMGKTRLPGIDELTEEYSRRLARYCEFEAAEIRAHRRKSGAAGGALKEEAAMLARSQGSRRVVLDPSGRQWTSHRFAEFFRAEQGRGTHALCFCVGGAGGFSADFKSQADLLLSLSWMTLPHELARVVLLEQIYRAWTILGHHPYAR